MADKFRKKPVVIEAMPFDGTWSTARPIIEWINDKDSHWASDTQVGVMKISTKEGLMTASPGDWIIRGVAGGFYPCKPDIFTKTYDPA